MVAGKKLVNILLDRFNVVLNCLGLPLGVLANVLALQEEDLL